MKYTYWILIVNLLEKICLEGKELDDRKSEDVS